MPSVESKITGAVLDRIRGRRRISSNEESGLAKPRASTEKVSVREAQFSDFDRVHALAGRLGQGPDSAENWSRLWQRNPALGHGISSRIGWVLEANGEIVGFLGSVPLLYQFHGSTIASAATCRFAVEPAYRAFSHLLMTSFLRQKDVELFLNTTATVTAGKIMTALKASPLPQPGYDTVLFWVLDPREFMKAVLKKMGVSPGPGSMKTGMASLGLKVEMALRGRKPSKRSPRYSIQQCELGDLGEEFDRFFAARAKQSSSLLAGRSSDILRWHFDPPYNRRPVQVLTCYAAAGLVGYAVVRHELDQETGLAKSGIADLLVEHDDPVVIEQLLAAAYQLARDAGTHVLEVLGFPASVRKVLLASRPYTRRYPACPFFFKARSQTLHEQLANENSWYACPFDGDTTLWP